jgi:hypothetical protein
LSVGIWAYHNFALYPKFSTGFHFSQLNGNNERKGLFPPPTSIHLHLK